MPRIAIDDLADSRIAVYHQFKRSNLTRDSGLFVVEGAKLVARLHSGRYPMASALRTGAESLNVAVAAGILLYALTSPTPSGTEHGR